MIKINSYYRIVKGTEYHKEKKGTIVFITGCEIETQKVFYIGGKYGGDDEKYLLEQEIEEIEDIKKSVFKTLFK